MGLDINAIKKESERQENEGNTDWKQMFVNFPTESTPYLDLRILNNESIPATEGGLFQPTRIHRMPVPGNPDQQVNVHCLRELEEDGKWRGDCVICTKYQALWKESEGHPDGSDEQEDLQNRARKIKPNERYYYNAIVRKELDPKTGDSTLNVGPKVWSVGQKLHKKVVRAIVGDEDKGIPALGDVTDLKEGREFRYIREYKKGGDGNNYPNYDASFFAQETTPAGDPSEIEEWMNNLKDLVALRKLLPEEDLLKHVAALENGPAEEEATSMPSEETVEVKEEVTVETTEETTEKAPFETDVKEDDTKFVPEDDFISRVMSK